jgi:hypothetical protein
VRGLAMASTSSSVMPTGSCLDVRMSRRCTSFSTEGEHLGKRRTDFVADDGDRRAGQGMGRPTSSPPRLRGLHYPPGISDMQRSSWA